jgi:hypothetical protein
VSAREEGWHEDEPLRAAALHAARDETAREALEAGALFVDPAVTTWEATTGTMRGHRVRLEVPEALLRRVEASPALVDALTAAVSTAVGRWSARDALVALELEAGEAGAPRGRGAPYRE